MRRTAIAAAWVIGATIPMLVAVVFVFGCCVLPFHGVIHKALPLCNYALGFIRGGHRGQPDQQTPAPAREKQEPVKRIATEVPRSFQLAVTSAAERVTASDATAYRSFIALGAVRCDQDVGLHLLIATLLI